MIMEKEARVLDTVLGASEGALLALFWACDAGAIVFARFFVILEAFVAFATKPIGTYHTFCATCNGCAHELVVLCWRPPCMPTPILTQRLGMTSVVFRVHAHVLEVLLNFAPARWEVSLVVPVPSMCHVMVLPDVEGIAIILAVVLVVADWLHAKLLALVDHDLCVGSTLLRSLRRGKEHLLCRHTVPAPKLRRKDPCPMHNRLKNCATRTLVQQPTSVCGTSNKPIVAG